MTTSVYFVIVNKRGKILAHNAYPLLGDVRTIHSHRFKNYAIVSLITFIREFYNFYQVEYTNKTIVFCDNKEVAMKMNIIIKNNKYRNQYRMSEIEAINNIIEIIPPLITIKYIHGRQDTKSIDKLYHYKYS